MVKLSGARPGLLWHCAVWAFLVGTAVVVLGPPVFPSQDGPVHLYYVDIIRSLLAHSGPYTRHFELKALLTPYALEYFSLLLLEMAFSPAVSEKLLVCGYILGFVAAFRYLVESVTERRSPWTLVGVPFCMNKLVYMGFMNYCMGVVLALFLSGFWIRSQGRLRPGRIMALLACFVLMLLTHPVPAAVFLLFIGVHFLVEVARATAAGSEPWMQALRARRGPLAMIACLGGIAVVWLRMFTNSPQSAPVMLNLDPGSWAGSAVAELCLSPVVPFLSLPYRAGLLCLLALTAIALLMGLWNRRAGAGSAAIALLATSAICFALYCLAPLSINGSFFFPQRFPIFWVMFLIAAAAAFRPHRLLNLAAGGIALYATSAVLLLQWVNVSRIAAEMTAVLDTPPVEAGTVGLIVGELPAHPKGFAFDPFFWGGAHYFRRSGAILANAPWLDLPIIMIRPTHPDRWSNLAAWDAGAALSGAARSSGMGSRSCVFWFGKVRHAAPPARPSTLWVGPPARSIAAFWESITVTLENRGLRPPRRRKDRPRSALPLV